MNALANDIRKLLADRISNASLADLVAVANSLCDKESAPAAPVKRRFTKLHADGKAAVDNCTDWVAVHDSETNLIWTRKPLDCGQLPWKAAVAAASKHRLFGKSDWHAPSTKELSSIIDHSKFAPAIDKTYFDTDGSWEWTSTVDAEDPSVFAWFVNLHFGSVYRFYQSVHYSVRAVRAGQALELGL